ncbi:MAG TPA: AI-2E family transporter, partial [Candidatus Paceibacterota bacterium]|nr:AI-2E family transporter [Candidatus Paceibacterota bacterium]
MAERVQMDISTGSILRAILLVLFFVFLYILKDVIIIFLFALVIASAISPFANWLEEKGFPRLLGVLLLYLIVLGLGIFVLSLIIPSLTNDINQLIGALPKVVQQVSSSLESAQQHAPNYLDFLSELQNVLDGISTYLQQASQSVVGLLV